MDKSLIEKYKNQMFDMYRKAKAVPTVAEPVADSKVENSANAQSQIPQMPPPDLTSQNSTGGIIAIVTSLKEIYPLKGAKVTIFTGNYNGDMNILDTDFTDESGRTKTFILAAPERQLSQSSGASEKPYASYNMMVERDGYIDNIHLNIPVFSGVVSLQGSDMMLLETAGVNKGPQIFDEGQEFTL